MRKQNILLQFQRINLIYNFIRVIDGLRNIAEKLRHFFCRFKIKLIVVESKTLSFHIVLFVSVLCLFCRLLFTRVDTK